ncbi:2-dehydro-3-deoxygalactonokinase [Roseomonas elaeocarpi]|uniref:2-dehydro-3-deoxygalactonokinase n=1 Tax=Roseomonas elaeocarpi TaxID=907779 RepID=A0ABV6JNQ9_9PROT
MADRGDDGRRIVLDWGTSSFRAMLVDGDGRVLERVDTGDGIATVADRDFAAVLRRALEPWGDRARGLPILAAGMIGSRNGWVEAPYVALPAGARELAAAVRREEVPELGTIRFIPGCTDTAVEPFPDVMRGEETQLLGFGLERDMAVVLPGTHSKWVRVGGERIRRFRTFATGELFALLSQHAFIARGAEAPAEPDEAAFRRGVEVALAGEGGLLARLFTVRAGWLSGGLRAAEMGDYLSGLVIGAEFREARDMGWFAPGEAVGVIGGAALARRYALVAEMMGLRPEPGPEDAALRGCLRVAAEMEGMA